MNKASIPELRSKLLEEMDKLEQETMPLKTAPIGLMLQAILCAYPDHSYEKIDAVIDQLAIRLKNAYREWLDSKSS